MYQRHVGPTVGALRRTLTADAAVTPKCSPRAFSVSARRVEDSKGAAPSAPASRKVRTTNALSQITRLGANRRAAGVQSGGLAKGSSPSGQKGGQGPPRVRPDGSLNITREAFSMGPRRGAQPPGAMARAPARLNLSRNNGPPTGRNAAVGGSRGPNLRARPGKVFSPTPGNRPPAGPKKRERVVVDKDEVDPNDIKFENTLSDGMMQHLLRLQRGQWDRKPYEPKYAPGSFAANQLIHQGRELFRGEAPPVKVWGRLEKRIGVVGMHNAAAHLKVRRVTDLDDESLGERRQHFESGGIDIEVKVNAPQTSQVAAQAPASKAPATDGPAAGAQVLAAKAPASEQAPVVQ